MSANSLLSHVGSNARLLRRNNERGIAIVVAMVVMALLLIFGAAALKVVNSQARQSGRERTNETAFSVAEALLSAQSVVLQSNWPNKPPCSPTAGGCGYVDTCTQANAAATPAQCPSPAELVGSGRALSNTDIAAGATWSVQVRDDIGGSATNNPVYVAGTVNGTGNGCVNAANAAATCTYDKNADNRMWVRVDATVHGVTRSLVGLFELAKFQLPIAHNSVVGGYVDFTNSGNKTFVDNSVGGGSQVVIRCTPDPTTKTTSAITAAGNNKTISVQDITHFTVGKIYALGVGGSNYEVSTLEAITAGNTLRFDVTNPHAIGEIISAAPPATDVNGKSCTHWDPTGHNPQVDPPSSWTTQPTYAATLSPAILDALTNGNGIDVFAPAGMCPTSWSGHVVIEQPPATGCTIPAGFYNTTTNPGFVVIKNPGTASPALTITGGNGNQLYHGVIYIANPNNVASLLLDFQGNASVQGGVAVDGPGGVSIGQASGNSPAVIFDPNAFLAFTGAGASGLVQNTWRELTANQ
jgi:Tfp pilus assembly protein PilX